MCIVSFFWVLNLYKRVLVFALVFLHTDFYCFILPIWVDDWIFFFYWYLQITCVCIGAYCVFLSYISAVGVSILPVLVVVYTYLYIYMYKRKYTWLFFFDDGNWVMRWVAFVKRVLVCELVGGGVRLQREPGSWWWVVAFTNEIFLVSQSGGCLSVFVRRGWRCFNSTR